MIFITPGDKNQKLFVHDNINIFTSINLFSIDFFCYKGEIFSFNLKQSDQKNIEHTWRYLYFSASGKKRKWNFGKTKLKVWKLLFS